MPIRLIEPRVDPAAASAVAPTWGVARLGASASPFDGAGVRVAVLDTSSALEAYRMRLRVFDSPMDLMRAKMEFNGGTVVCASNGNESERKINTDVELSASVPAAALGAVSVGALSEGANGLKVAPFSNTNPVVSAPGAAILPLTSHAVEARLLASAVRAPFASGVDAADRGRVSCRHRRRLSPDGRRRRGASALAATSHPGGAPSSEASMAPRRASAWASAAQARAQAPPAAHPARTSVGQWTPR